MAKIDVSTIEGFANMTAEQKAEALANYEFPDPDYTGYVKKDVFDKTASELASWKKKHNELLSEEERKIDTAYEQIGKWYAEKHREDAEEDVKTWLDAIAASEARIKECRESIHQMKGVAICPSCGASVDADAAFCSACGQKMPEKPKPEPVKEEDVEVIPPEQPSEEPASETVSENASETPTKASAPDASTEA